MLSTGLLMGPRHLSGSELIRQEAKASLFWMKSSLGRKWAPGRC